MCLLEQYNFKLSILHNYSLSPLSSSMEYFPILEMPEEIQALVVEHVAGNSFQDLYGLRASCIVDEGVSRSA